MLKNYIKAVIRNILKYKSFSFINIAGLSIGLACTVLILMWVQNEISFDRFHQDSHRLYRVGFLYRPLNIRSYRQPGALAEKLKNDYPEIIHVSYYKDTEDKISIENRGFFQKGAYVDPDFFEMFSFPFIQGNPKSAFNDLYSIILTEDLSYKIFGNKNSIGQTITLNDNTEFKVTGIIKSLPANTQFQFDYLVPFKVGHQWWKNWNSKTGYVYVKLDENNDYKSVNSKIAGIIDQINPAWENTLFLYPLNKDHLYPLRGSSPIVYVYIFSSIAVIILLIACINFMNLSTALSDKRSREIAIRKVVGSNRGHLAFQFLIESMVYTVIAMLIALVVITGHKQPVEYTSW